MPVVYTHNRYIYCWLVSALLEFTFVTGYKPLRALSLPLCCYIDSQCFKALSWPRWSIPNPLVVVSRVLAYFPFFALPASRFFSPFFSGLRFMMSHLSGVLNGLP